MMTKSDMIAEIIRLNPTASAPFLAEFPSEALVEYLRRLDGLPGSPRGGTEASLRLSGAVHSANATTVAGAA